MKFKSWKAYALGLFTLVGWSTSASAQVPPPPPVVPVAPVAAAPAAAPAAPGNLWSFLLPNAAQKAACREHCCNSALGKILSATMQPFAALSGGLIQDHCAIPTAAELALPPDSPGGAAAKIKADELAAAARRQDVRYLGTVDCSRWPEAEEALINALRGDRNECVRMEAALALGRGCCCTPKTVAALSITVAGSNQDGFPIERSDRVRAAAAAALDHCLACLQPHGGVGFLPGAVGPEVLPKVDPKEPPPPGGEPIPPGAGVLPPAAQAPGKVPASLSAEQLQTRAGSHASFYQKVDRNAALLLLQHAKKTAPQMAPAASATVGRPGKTNGLLEIMTTAFTPSPSPMSAPNYQVYPANPGPVLGPAPMHGGIIIEETPPKNRGLLPRIWGPQSSNGSKYTAPSATLAWKTDSSSPYSTVTPPARVTTVVPATAVAPQTIVAPRMTVVPASTAPVAAPVQGSGYLAQPKSIDQILDDATQGR
jgi:hypothetical protein